MRSIVAWTLSGALFAAPLAARADISGCLLGPDGDLNRCTVTGAPATALAAVAAPVLLVGAAATIAHELNKRTVERQPDDNATTPTTASKGKHTPPNLALVPDPPDPYRARAGAAETRHKPNPAFEFNETATNVATVVAGAAVVGAMIATIVKSTK